MHTAMSSKRATLPLPLELRVMIAEVHPLAWLGLAQVDREFLTYTRHAGISEKERAQWAYEHVEKHSWGRIIETGFGLNPWTERIFELIDHTRFFVSTRCTHDGDQKEITKHQPLRPFPKFFNIELLELVSSSIMANFTGEALGEMYANNCAASTVITATHFKIADICSNIEARNATFAQIDINGQTMEFERRSDGVWIFPHALFPCLMKFTDLRVNTDAEECSFTATFLPKTIREAMAKSGHLTSKNVAYAWGIGRLIQ